MSNTNYKPLKEEIMFEPEEKKSYIRDLLLLRIDRKKGQDRF